MTRKKFITFRRESHLYLGVGFPPTHCPKHLCCCDMISYIEGETGNVSICSPFWTRWQGSQLQMQTSQLTMGEEGDGIQPLLVAHTKFRHHNKLWLKGNCRQRNSSRYLKMASILLSRHTHTHWPVYPFFFLFRKMGKRQARSKHFFLDTVKNKLWKKL